MKAVVLAYHDIGCIGIEALRRNGIEIAAILTHQDDPHENTWFASVAELGASMGVPVFAPMDINHPLWVRRIRELAPDILFSFYYRNIVRQPILDIPRAGCLNLHGSLLPSYRGRCPINWVLLNGETQTGVTLHYMTAKPDDGDIVGQRTIRIDDEDTALSLHRKAAEAAGRLLDEALPLLARGEALRIKQDPSKASYFGGRGPEDGEIDWTAGASRVRNLVRAVTRPYPGAFSYLGGKKCFFWKVTETLAGMETEPGAVIHLDPLAIGCGEGAVQIDSGQSEGGIYVKGSQLASELGLKEGMKFGPAVGGSGRKRRKTSILILGVNGFIGNALGRRLLAEGNYEVHGMDLHSNHVQELMSEPGFHFDEGDIAIHREWIEYHVKKCDVVLPLVAIATPIEYVRNPLRVFELDFEENVRVIRYCAQYRKRIIFPSTSEVYGLCDEAEFDEDNSKLVLGPIRMQRWIYACIKQLIDRVIWAYGQQGLKFSLFRPFNWIGPHLDSLDSARIGSSRAITQLILNLAEGTPIQLIDGGEQKRCFTDVDDGIECLFRIIENKGGKCDGRIFNIGNPNNEASIRELAEMLVSEFEKHPLRPRFPPFAGMRLVESESYYGKGYEDVQHRKPSIRNAQKILGWTPKAAMVDSVRRTLDCFLQEAVESGLGAEPLALELVP